MIQELEARTDRQAVDAAILDLYAKLLDYPHDDLCAIVAGCRARLAGAPAEQPSLALVPFEQFVAASDVRRLQEQYSATFDFGTATCLYVGHHLFGADWRRGALMVGLKQEYAARGFETGRELPDHLAVMLHFIAAHDEEPEVVEMLDDCVRPALVRMLECFRPAGGCEHPPYRSVLESLLLYLGQPSAVSRQLSAREPGADR